MKQLQAQQVVTIGSLAFLLVHIDESQRDGDIPALHAMPTPVPDETALEFQLVDGECVDIDGRHWTLSLEDEELCFYPEHPMNASLPDNDEARPTNEGASAEPEPAPAPVVDQAKGELVIPPAPDSQPEAAPEAA